jgi:hypothetical protein
MPQIPVIENFCIIDYTLNPLIRNIIMKQIAPRANKDKATPTQIPPQFLLIEVQGILFIAPPLHIAISTLIGAFSLNGIPSIVDPGIHIAL